MKKIIPICLFLCLCFVGFAFAEEEIKEINETNLFRVYQVTNDGLNRLIYTLTFIASALMLFFLIGTCTFLYRQYEEDKKTKRRAIAFEKYLELSRKNIKAREQEIEKIFKAIASKKPKTGKEPKEFKVLLEKLKKEIKDLRGEVNFQEGKISTVSGLSSSASIISSPSSTDGLLITSTPDIFEGISKLNYCPKCSHINEYGAKFCSNCGKRL